MPVLKAIKDVTDRIAARSAETRADYLRRLDGARAAGVNRAVLSCGNLAHGFAACSPADKAKLAGNRAPNLGIVTSYNDMLSAHQPYQFYPDLIKAAAREVGATAQVAGGVPAMCDGVTQGQPGMDLSLFSPRRDRHGDGDRAQPQHVRCRGVSGHLRQDRAGAADRRAGASAICRRCSSPRDRCPRACRTTKRAASASSIRKARSAAPSCSRPRRSPIIRPGTCTFYGTANSNQMLMEIMGLHLPGASFVNPGTPLREALTREAAKRALSLTAEGNAYTPVGPRDLGKDHRQRRWSGCTRRAARPTTPSI